MRCTCVLVLLTALGCVSPGRDTGEDLAGDAGDTEEGWAETWTDAAPEARDAAPDTPYTPPSGLEITFLDVGQGDSTLIRFPGGATMLVDGGSKSMGTGVILPFLEGLHLDHLDVVVVTHPDADHCGGLDDVVLSVDVDEVWENGWTGDTWAWQDFSDAVDARGVDRRVVARGYTRTMDGCQVTVLNADEGWDDSNGNSVVLSVDCDGFRGLLPGDVGAAAQAEMLDAVPDLLPSRIAKLPHHGSADQDPAFAAAVGPELAACSVGEMNSYGHPSAEALQAWEAAGAEILRTDDVGTIIVQARDGGFTVETEW